MSYENTSEVIPDKVFPLTLIPQDTDYCYSRDENGVLVYCPFFYKRADGAGCSYLNIKCKEYARKHCLLWDAVKECGIGYGEPS